jgi:hypothetical protein
MTTQIRLSRPSRFSAFKAIILCLLAGFSSVAFAQSTYLTSKEPAKTSIDGVEYYQISKCTELAWFRDQVNAGYTDINAILTKNVNCYANSLIDTTNASNWIPIGKDSSVAYKGIFNGGNFTISNIYMDKDQSTYGLFAYVSGTLKNLNVKNFFYDIRSTNLTSKKIGGVVTKAFDKAVLENVRNLGFANNNMFDTLFQYNYGKKYERQFLHYGLVAGEMEKSVLDNSEIQQSYVPSKSYSVTDAGHISYPLVGFVQKNSVVKNCGTNANYTLLANSITNSQIENSFLKTEKSYLKSSFSSISTETRIVNSYTTACTDTSSDKNNRFKGCKFYRNENYISDIGFYNVAGKGFEKALTPSQEFADEYPYFFSLSVTLNEWVDRQKQGLYNRWTLGEKGYPVFGSDIEKTRKLWTDDGNYDVSWYNESASNFNITSAKALAGLAVIVNGYKSEFHDNFEGKTITLSSNIDSASLAKFIWVPIGTHDTPFLGTFDGEKHSISGIIMDSLSQNAALFGYNQGTIKNVNIDKSLLSGSWVAGIAVHNYGTIDSCLVNAKIYTMMGGAGIAVHNGLNAKVANSEFVGSFSAKSLVWEKRDSLNLKWIFDSSIKGFINGGIVGLNEGRVQNVSSSGSALFALYCTAVSSDLSDYGKGLFYYGGIVGNNTQSGTIESAENRTEIKILGAASCKAYYINNFVVANIVGYNAGIVENAYSNADSLNVSTCNLGRAAGVVGVNASSGIIDKTLTQTALNVRCDRRLCKTSASGIVGKNDGTVKNSGSMGNIYVDSYDSYVSNSNTYSGVVAGIASDGNGKIYNSFNVGNLLCKDSTGNIGACLLYGLGVNNYFANTYNYGNISGASRYKYQFGRDIDAYNSYAIEGSADSIGHKITDSYIYNSDAAMGLEDMTYYDMEDGEEVQGTLLEALNHWVQYRADNLGETYVAWKQGEKYPELDIEWSALESSSSTPVESSSSETESSSSEIESSSSSEIASNSSDESSSSKAETSSSTKPESSSSSKANSSSSKGTDIVWNAVQPTFNLAVSGMTLTLSNMQGGVVRIFDALGHLVAAKPLASATTSITLQTPGNYIVRVNGISRSVTLK